MSTTTSERHAPRMRAVARQSERVTPLELFFDLVFVLALTQCTTLIVQHPTWLGVAQGLLVLAVLWWAWVGYAWLTSVVDPEEGAVRLMIFAAMAALLVCALCVPGAFGAERRLSRAHEGRERNELARDSYSYLHFPMVAGIGLLAVGMKLTIEGVSRPLALVPAAALLGGASLYLLALVGFRLRNMGSLSVRRLVCAVLLLALLPLVHALAPASLLTLGILAAVLCALILYEVLRYAEFRDRVRHHAVARES